MKILSNVQFATMMEDKSSAYPLSIYISRNSRGGYKWYINVGTRIAIFSSLARRKAERGLKHFV